MSARKRQAEPRPRFLYLIHLDEPFGHAGHYLGSTTDLERRMRQHGTKEGARLLQAVRNAGISWQVSRTWDLGSVGLSEALTREYALKRQGGLARLCPLCRKPGWRARGTGRAIYTPTP